VFISLLRRVSSYRNASLVLQDSFLRYHKFSCLQDLRWDYVASRAASGANGDAFAGSHDDCLTDMLHASKRSGLGTEVARKVFAGGCLVDVKGRFPGTQLSALAIFLSHSPPFIITAPASHLLSPQPPRPHNPTSIAQLIALSISGPTPRIMETALAAQLLPQSNHLPARRSLAMEADRLQATNTTLRLARGNKDMYHASHRSKWPAPLAMTRKLGACGFVVAYCF
jgi:hypothetical protein